MKTVLLSITSLFLAGLIFITNNDVMMAHGSEVTVGLVRIPFFVQIISALLAVICLAAVLHGKFIFNRVISTGCFLVFLLLSLYNSHVFAWNYRHGTAEDTWFTHIFNTLPISGADPVLNCKVNGLWVIMKSPDGRKMNIFAGIYPLGFKQDELLDGCIK